MLLPLLVSSKKGNFVEEEVHNSAVLVDTFRGRQVPLYVYINSRSTAYFALLLSDDV